MDVRLPDGRVVKNVPDGTTKEQLLAKVGPIDVQGMFADTQRHRAMEAATASDPISRDALETSQEGKMPTWLAGAPGASYAERVSATPGMQLATGAAAPFMGAEQFLLNLTPAKDQVNANRQTFAEMQDRGGAGGFNPFNFAGQVLSPANRLISKLPAATSGAGKIAQGGAIGAAAGAASPVANASDYWSTKGDQTAYGAAGGAAVPTAGVLADFLLGKGSRVVMQSAMKPSSAEPAEKVDRAITTMLDNGINVTRGGMTKLRGLSEEANQESAAALNASNATIDPRAVATRLADTDARFTSQVAPQSDLAAIDATRQAFATHPQLAGQQSMPVQLAQQLKQGTYTQLRDKYGQLGTADVEAQKALARGLKEEIEKAVPGVVEPNARATELWNALNVAQRRAMVAGNNNPLGLTAALLNHPGPAAAMALDRSTLVRSLAARGMHQANRAIQPVARSKQAALAAALLAKEGANE